MTDFLQLLPPVYFPVFPVPLIRCTFQRESYHDGLFDEYHIHFPGKLRQASPLRRAEYLAGRYLAQQLLQQAGYGNMLLSTHSRGAPAWPEGIVGSLSHTHETAICAIHRAPHVIGIDVENVIA